MPRRPQRDDSFIAFVQSALDRRRREITDAVMAGIDEHGRYRAEAGRAAGIDEAEGILLECWRTWGTEDDDQE
jgi:hypothetical protein